jgi:hypothetical protein
LSLPGQSVSGILHVLNGKGAVPLSGNATAFQETGKTEPTISSQRELFLERRGRKPTGVVKNGGLIGIPEAVGLMGFAGFLGCRSREKLSGCLLSTRPGAEAEVVFDHIESSSNHW